MRPITRRGFIVPRSQGNDSASNGNKKRYLLSVQTLEKAIKKVLSVQKLKLPDRPRVEDIKFSQIVDSIGDAALRVMVILDESTTDEEREWTSLAPIAAAIHNALTEAEIDLWPYIRFRKLSEQSMAMAEQ